MTPTQQNFPKCLLHGIDSLYVSYPFNAKSSKIDWENLAYLKERMKADGNADGVELQLGCQRFMLQPYGSKPYSYVLRNRDFIVRLSENLNPCCHVQFLSEGLWQRGPQGQLKQFDLWAASVNLASHREPTVSRADWAFDFHLDNIDFSEDDFISLASKDSKHRKDRRAQTFTFGTGDKVVRIYDKTAEIEEASGKTWFYELWDRSTNVWRIEFQLRGDALREAGIKTLPDLFVRQAGLLNHLAKKHTSLRVPSSDGNRSRWPVHPLWTALLGIIAAFPTQVRGEPLDGRLPVRLRLLEQEKSLYGHMKSVCTLLTILDGRDEPMSLDETLTRLRTSLIVRHHQSAEWKSEIERRRTLHQLGEW